MEDVARLSGLLKSLGPLLIGLKKYESAFSADGQKAYEATLAAYKAAESQVASIAPSSGILGYLNAGTLHTAFTCSLGCLGSCKAIIVLDSTLSNEGIHSLANDSLSMHVFPLPPGDQCDSLKVATTLLGQTLAAFVGGSVPLPRSSKDDLINLKTQIVAHKMELPPAEQLQVVAQIKKMSIELKTQNSDIDVIEAHLDDAMRSILQEVHKATQLSQEDLKAELASLGMGVQAAWSAVPPNSDCAAFLSLALNSLQRLHANQMGNDEADSDEPDAGVDDDDDDLFFMPLAPAFKLADEGKYAVLAQPIAMESKQFEIVMDDSPDSDGDVHSGAGLAAPTAAELLEELPGGVEPSPAVGAGGWATPGSSALAAAAVAGAAVGPVAPQGAGVASQLPPKYPGLGPASSEADVSGSGGSGPADALAAAVASHGLAAAPAVTEASTAAAHEAGAASTAASQVAPAMSHGAPALTPASAVGPNACRGPLAAALNGNALGAETQRQLVARSGPSSDGSQQMVPSLATSAAAGAATSTAPLGPDGQPLDGEKLKQFVNFLNGENPGACMFHAQMRLSYDGCIKLSNFLRSSHRVRALSLSHNYIGDEGLRIICDGLRTNTSVTALDLPDNNISDVGIKHLIHAIQDNQALTQLQLAYNKIGDEGAAALAGIIEHSTSLRKLGVSHNRIGRAGCQALTAAISVNQSLQHLQLLPGNPVDEKDAKALAKALKRNKKFSIRTFLGLNQEEHA